MDAYYAHPSAEIEIAAQVGRETKIWHSAQIRLGAKIGARCTLGKGVFIDANVEIGDACKIQNYACIYRGARLGSGVFVGPHALLLNDQYPRATDREFNLKRDEDWSVGETIVEDGVSIGANATVLTGVRVGKWAVVAAGALLSRNAPPYALMIGAPARRVSWVCTCGRTVSSASCGECGILPEDHPLHHTAD